MHVAQKNLTIRYICLFYVTRITFLRWIFFSVWRKGYPLNSAPSTSVQCSLHRSAGVDLLLTLTKTMLCRDMIAPSPVRSCTFQIAKRLDWWQRPHSSETPFHYRLFCLSWQNAYVSFPNTDFAALIMTLGIFFDSSETLLYKVTILQVKVVTSVYDLPPLPGSPNTPSLVT